MIDFTDEDREILREAAQELESHASDYSWPGKKTERIMYLAGRLAGLSGRPEALA